MTKTQIVALLTEKEREALRALHQNRYLSQAADTLGLSDSGIRSRLESATKKAGMDRWQLATLVGQEQGWLPRDSDTGRDQQIPADPDDGFSLPPSAEHEAVRLEEARPVFDHSPPPPVTIPLPRLTRNGADGNDLTVGRRVAAILIWCLIGIMVFCLLMATLEAFGNLGLNLKDHGVPQI